MKIKNFLYKFSISIFISILILITLIFISIMILFIISRNPALNKLHQNNRNYSDGIYSIIKIINTKNNNIVEFENINLSEFNNNTKLYVKNKEIKKTDSYSIQESAFK